MPTQILNRNLPCSTWIVKLSFNADCTGNKQKSQIQKAIGEEIQKSENTKNFKGLTKTEGDLILGD